MSIFNLITIYANHTLNFLLESKTSMDPALISYMTSYLSDGPHYSLANAIQNDNVEMIVFMQTNGMIPSLHTLLYDSIRSFSIKIMKYAINAGADVNQTRAVRWCAMQKDNKFNYILQVLLAIGADPSKGSPLSIATNHNNIIAMKLLLEYGAKATHRDLLKARSVPAARLLIENGASLTSEVLLSLLIPDENYHCEDPTYLLSYYVEFCGVKIDSHLLTSLVKFNKLDEIQYLVFHNLIPISADTLDKVLSSSSQIPLVSTSPQMTALLVAEKRDEIISFLQSQFILTRMQD